MKQWIALWGTVFLLLCLTACGSQLQPKVPVPLDKIAELSEEAETPMQAYSIDGTIFRYQGTEYDLTARNGSINSILSCTPVGKYIVLDGHVGPNAGVYCIFNTERMDFEPDMIGAHLIWHDDDLATAVYSVGPEVCRYDGSVLTTFPLTENEYIYELEFLNENSDLGITILDIEGNQRQEITSLS